MKENDLINCLNKVYEFTERVTPLNFDCGKICSGKCCSGDSEDGMLLLPGEEEFFKDKENFTVYYDERYGNQAVRCNASCNRKERPFACRIFPYFIYADKITGRVSVAPDIRALDYCPLIAQKYEVDKSFLRALRISATKLSGNREMFDFFCRISEILTDFNSLDL